MRKINVTTYLLIVGFVLGNIQFSNAQFLKKLKDAAEGKTTSTSNTSKGSSKMIGESEVSNDFVVDEYGFNGIYYSQTKNGIIKTNMQFEICKEKSKAKGAEDMQACISLKYEIPETNTTIWRSTVHNDGYAIPESIKRNNRLYFEGRGYGDIFQIESGVLFMSASNWKGVISSSDPSFKKENFDFEDYVKSGSFYVKNKEDLNKWTNSPETQEKLRTVMTETMETISSIYSEVEGKKNANNEMPSIGKLNSKFIQDRALKTYKEKYEPINKGWTHHYMYVHGNEWVNKKKYNAYGVLVDTHRELHVVIVRTNPQGQCKADLMYYVELYENGKYDAANGKVTGPVSYIGMPGGYLPCEKTIAFKSKLAK